MDILSIGALITLLAIPLGMLFNGQSAIRKELNGVERDVLLKDEVEKMIGLYIDPIKNDVQHTRKGVEDLSTQFRELELLIARELGRRDGQDKDHS